MRDDSRRRTEPNDHGGGRDLLPTWVSSRNLNRAIMIPSWQDSRGRESRSMRTQSSFPSRACSLYGMVNVTDIILPLKCSDDSGPKSCSEEP